MGFKIKLNNISVPSGNQFKVFYKLNSRTPGNVTYQGDTEWGTYYGTYTGGTTTDIEIDFDTIDPSPFGKQHWFKILDTVTGSYIIENIHIHEYEYYYYCDHCCDLSGGTASFLYSCDFGGTAIYDSGIEVTPTPTPTEIPGDPADCSEGMDVVFLVDYTGSMGTAINGVKTTISSIVDTIITESNNNYRLGLVIYDEYTSGVNSTYSTKSDYISLPSNQKYINTGIGGKYQWITSLEKMSSNNETAFTTKLNLLNNAFGGGWPIGDGQSGPEPADIGIDLIATNDVTGYEYIGGEFRSGVSKLIILITDNSPSGNDDNYTQTDIDYIATLTPKLVNQNIRLLLMTTYSSTALNTLAIDTNGLVNIGFSGENIITAIEEICVPEPTSTPTPIPTSTPTPTPTSTSTPTPTPTEVNPANFASFVQILWSGTTLENVCLFESPDATNTTIPLRIEVGSGDCCITGINDDLTSIGRRWYGSLSPLTNFPDGWYKMSASAYPLYNNRVVQIVSGVVTQQLYCEP